MPRSPILVLALCCATAASFGQASFRGTDLYPEFRSLSGLPGGMYGLTKNGHVSIGGAMGISTPVAYSLSGGHFVLTGANTSFDSRFRFPDTSTGSQTGGNGTAAFEAGITSPAGNFTYGYMVLSTKLNHVHNLQFTPKVPWEHTRVALGVQDLRGKGGASGDTIDALGGFNSRSIYVVVTQDFPCNIYASIGKGDRRFQNGMFGNLSVPLGDRARGVVEYDTFNWNFGAAIELMPHRCKYSVQGFVGSVAGKYATLGLTLGF